MVKADINTVYYTKNSTINYTQPCINNGSLCSNSALCNITILYANDSALIYNKNMTNSNNGFFSTLLYPNQTSMNGLYKSYIFCIDGTAKGYSINQFGITSRGQPPANDNFLFMIYLLFIIAAGGMIYSLIRIIEKFSELDVGAMDLMISIGFFILMYVVMYLSSTYIIDTFIEDWALLLTKMLGYGLVIGSIIGYIVSSIVRQLTQKKQEREN